MDLRRKPVRFKFPGTNQETSEHSFQRWKTFLLVFAVARLAVSQKVKPCTPEKAFSGEFWIIAVGFAC